MRVLAGIFDWREIGRTKYGFAPLLVLSLTGVIFGLEADVTELGRPDIRRELGVDLNTFASVTMVSVLFVVFGGFALAYYADRRPRKPVLLVGALAFGVSYLCLGFVGGTAGLVVFLIVIRLGTVVNTIPIYSLLFDYYPPEVRGKVFALIGSLVNVSALASALVAGFAISRLGWRLTFQSVGLLMLAACVVVLVLLREPIRGYFERKALGASEEVAEAAILDSPPLGRSLRMVISIRTVRRLMLADALNAGGQAIYLTLFSFYLADSYGLDTFARGQVLFVASTAGVLGVLVGGSLVDRLTSLRPDRVMLVPAGYAAVVAVSVALVALHPPLPAVVALNAVQYFGMSMIGPAMVAVYSQVLHPNVRTLGWQMTGVATVPGTILFLPLATTIQGVYGYGAALFVAVPLALVGAVVQFFSARHFAEDRVRVMEESFDTGGDRT